MQVNSLLPGTPKHEIATPALLIDQEMMLHNIQQMATLGQKMNIAIRPHTKTHKCPQIARLQIAAGAVGICSATLGEAEVMAAYGIEDILITRMVIGKAKISRLIALSRQIRLAVVTDSLYNAQELAKYAAAEQTKLNVLIELNVGNDRCGVEPASPTLLEIAKFIDNDAWLVFSGLQGYAGHTPLIMDADQQKSETAIADAKGVSSKDFLEKAGIKVPVLTGGASGTATMTGRAGYSELQTGSYVTMDSEYSKVCGDVFQPALTMLATVISKPSPNWVIIDAGGKSLSVDHGSAVLKGYPQYRYHFVGDEYGKIEALNGSPVEFEIGDQVELYPSHGCTTVNLHDLLYIIRNNQLEAVWPVASRGRVD